MSNKLVWIDLETTGLDPEVDTILEIACIVTDNELNRLDYCSIVIAPEIKHIVNMSEVPRFMHEKSGLLNELRNSQMGPKTAEQEISLFLKHHKERLGFEKSPLCGSSVHFDRAFLKKQMPIVEEFFHYRNIDVSTVRQLVKTWMPDYPEFVKQDKHRALPDAADSIKELKHYRKIFKC